MGVSGGETGGQKDRGNPTETEGHGRVCTVMGQ